MIAAATAVSGLCAAALVVRGRTLRRQLLGVAVLGVIVPLLAVLGSGLLMLSHRDLQVLGIACLAGLVSVGGALTATGTTIGRNGSQRYASWRRRPRSRASSRRR